MWTPESEAEAHAHGAEMQGAEGYVLSVQGVPGGALALTTRGLYWVGLTTTAVGDTIAGLRAKGVPVRRV